MNAEKVPVAVERRAQGRALTDVRLTSLDDVYRVAQYACAMLGKNPEFAPVMAGCIMYGAEAGLSPMEAANSVYVIKGRPSLSAEAKHALVLSHPACRWFRVWSHAAEGGELAATAETHRDGDPEPQRVTVTAGQFSHLSSGSDGWKRYPDRMLIARARSRLAQQVYPDVLRGLATAEEVRDEPALEVGWSESPAEEPDLAPADGGEVIADFFGDEGAGHVD